MDLFRELFRMQADLNNYTFKKQGISDNRGFLLNMERLQGQAMFGAAQPGAETKLEAPKLGPNSEVCKWLRNYLAALNKEAGELEADLPWKWWSKDHMDMQNIRVEIVDMLHFWISLAITAGMDADEVFRLYTLKNKVNLERQNSGYSQATKNEADNKGVV